MTIDGCRGKSLIELEPQLLASFRFFVDNIQTARVVDPANSNNVISDEIPLSDKRSIKQAAQAALDARYWVDVFSS
jgi:hypothetical protein